MKRSDMWAVLGGGILLIALTGGTAAYVTQETIKENNKPEARVEKVYVRETARAPAPAPAPVQQQARAQECDDGNVVGHVIGGAAGGIAGSQVGSGSGQTAATIAGALGGAYLGGEYIPTRNVICP